MTRIASKQLTENRISGKQLTENRISGLQITDNYFSGKASDIVVSFSFALLAEDGTELLAESGEILRTEV